MAGRKQQQVETLGTARQTTGQTAAWQHISASKGLHAHLIWAEF